MSDVDHGPVGGSAASGVALYALLPHGVYRASCPQYPHLGQQTPPPAPAVPGCQPDASPVWSADAARPTRRNAGLAHLGPDAQCPLPSPLSGARWCVSRERYTLGAHPATLPLPCPGLEHRLPRQVLGILTTGPQQRGVGLHPGVSPEPVSRRLHPTPRPTL